MKPGEPELPVCDDASRELLDFYLNGTLEGDEHERVRAHIERCVVCADELDTLSGFATAIERHGTARRASAARVSARWLALAAAIGVGAVTGLLWFDELGKAPATTDVASGAVELDLGAGVLREAGELPAITLGPNVASVRLSFFPPLAAGERPRVGVVDATGRLVVPERIDLPPLDPVGRAVVVIPASSLSPGTYELVVGPDETDPDATVVSFPFEVRRSSKGAT